MKLKPTKSGDGKLRASIRVEFRIGRDELIDAMCHRIMQDGLAITGVSELVAEIEDYFSSRAFVMKTVVKSYHDFGADKIPFWTDGVETFARQFIIKFVSEKIDVLFPEFKPL